MLSTLRIVARRSLEIASFSRCILCKNHTESAPCTSIAPAMLPQVGAAPASSVPAPTASAQPRYSRRSPAGCSRRPSAVPSIPAAPANSPGKNSISIGQPCSISRCWTNIAVR